MSSEKLKRMHKSAFYGWLYSDAWHRAHILWVFDVELAGRQQSRSQCSIKKKAKCCSIRRQLNDNQT